MRKNTFFPRESSRDLLIKISILKKMHIGRETGNRLFAQVIVTSID